MESFLLRALRGDYISWEALSWSMVSSPRFTLILVILVVDLSQTPTPRPHPRPMNSHSQRGEPTRQHFILKLPPGDSNVQTALKTIKLEHGMHAMKRVENEDRKG